MHQNIKNVAAALLMLLVTGAFSTVEQAAAKPAAKQTKPAPGVPMSNKTMRYADGTTTTRNADGTVDVSDGQGYAESAGDATTGTYSSGSGGGGSQKVVARQVRSGSTHYADGVTVKRNADGSVEVSDPPTIERWGSCAVPSTVHKRAAGKSVKRHK